MLGDVGHYGPITDVKLTAAYATGLSGAITLTPSQADPALLPAPDDPSVPLAPVPVTSPSSALTPSGACGNNGTVGTIPCLGNGKPLAKHGEYGSTQWKEYALGNLTLTDSPIGDYIGAPPTVFSSSGQINAYDVAVSDFPPGTVIHFDTFNHIVLWNGKTKYVFAPFSHDALDNPSVPEPSSFFFLAAGAVAFWGLLLIRSKAGSRSRDCGQSSP